MLKILALIQILSYEGKKYFFRSHMPEKKPTQKINLSQKPDLSSVDSETSRWRPWLSGMDSPVRIFETTCK
jgi:hypothetical protein